MPFLERHDDGQRGGGRVEERVEDFQELVVGVGVEGAQEEHVGQLVA